MKTKPTQESRNDRGERPLLDFTYTETAPGRLLYHSYKGVRLESCGIGNYRQDGAIGIFMPLAEVCDDIDRAKS